MILGEPNEKGDCPFDGIPIARIDLGVFFRKGEFERGYLL